MIEFALCFLLFVGTVLGFGQVAMAIWIKTTLHHAVREGGRYAITGRTFTGLGHDASIRKIVTDKSIGLIDPAQAASLIQIEYFDQSGAPTSDNDGNNTLALSIANYPIPQLVPGALSFSGAPITVSVRTVDRMEPLRNPPTR
ncbi:MAG: pilus assembly protein [Pirellulales bacterium]|nr:pilus assembly protein [Pirellulales bacterium]